MDDTERNAMVSLVAHRMWHESRAGATGRPLRKWETLTLAGAVVDLIEECQPVRHLTPAEILSELRGPVADDFDHQAQTGQGPPA